VITRFRILSVALAVGALAAVPAFALQTGPPPGATAQCRDGTYSYSQHHSGTCSHHGGVAKWLDGSSGSSGGGTTTTPAPGGSINVGNTVLLAPRTRTAGCVVRPSPDRRCSPGAYYSGLSTAVLCSSTFRTGTIRNVPDSEKHADELEYGMVPRAYGHTIEIDHIVSLELGGSNDIANLFPEPGSGPANYHVKDKLENKLHSLVCAGSMTLRSAQVGIAGNWETLYAHVFGVNPVD
jgi:hypothetical protein